MVTTWGELSFAWAWRPLGPVAPSDGGGQQARFPAQAEPLLNIVSEASPQHLAAGFLQTAHAELPQSELGLQPQVAEFRHRSRGGDKRRAPPPSASWRRRPPRRGHSHCARSGAPAYPAYTPRATHNPGSRPRAPGKPDAPPPRARVGWRDAESLLPCGQV